MTTARAEPVATLLADGTVMVAGGFASDGTGLNSAEIYNPATGIFTPIATGFYSEFVSTLTLLPNGKVLGTGAGGAIGEVYNPATGTFSATGNLLAPSLQFDTATLLPNGTVLVAGGDECCYVVYSSAEIFNPATNTFSATGSMSTARGVATATLLPNGTVLVAGGDDLSPTWWAAGPGRSPCGNLQSGDGLLHRNWQHDHAPRGGYCHAAANGKVLLVGGDESGTAELYQP